MFGLFRMSLQRKAPESWNYQPKSRVFQYFKRYH
jgi:hypothetical protein